MQHYIHYGLGFSAEYLTNEEYDYLVDNKPFPNNNEIAIDIVSFTEDYEGKDWATVVIKNCGMLPTSGKMITFADLKKLCSKELIIDIPTKEKIKRELGKVSLGHLLEKVEVVIYSENY